MRLKTLYINNYRCLQNFTLEFDASVPTLLLGGNGMGKSTVLNILQVLRTVADGNANAGSLFSGRDFAFFNYDAPITIEVTLEDVKIYKYAFSIAYEQKGNKIYVADEVLEVDSERVLDRSQVNLRSDIFAFATLVEKGEMSAVISQVCSYISSWVLISPWMNAISVQPPREDNRLEVDGANFLNWFHAIMGTSLEYSDEPQRQLAKLGWSLAAMQWTNVETECVHELLFEYSGKHSNGWIARFTELSDGEKCMVVGAAIMVLNIIRPGILCFWDEPDNFLAVSEVQGMITRLIKVFGEGRGQLILTSHNLETIRTFSIEETIRLSRRSHLEPVRVQRVSDLLLTEKARNDYIQDVLSGDIYGL